MRRSISASTPTPCGSTIPTRLASSARRSKTAMPSAESSSAAPASAPRSPSLSWTGSVVPCVTTSIRPTRVSSTTPFQKAISQGDLYDEQIRACLEETDDPKEIFWKLAERDIGDACDVLRGVWHGTDRHDGYVSIEVDPNLAADTEATIDEAQRLHDQIDRPNLFVKIPATKEGLPAIEEMIARGKNINVTLIFSLERYAEVAEAYIRGLERLVDSGGDPSKVASVARFFVSRVDTETDKPLA